MAEGTYEYECMRAELLGIEAPNRETFEAQLAKQREQEEQIEIEDLQKLEAEGEQMTSTGGKLDELNTILSKTQHKLNNFKHACGSLTNLLKVRSGFSDSKENLNATTTASAGLDSENPQPTSSSINEANDALDEMKANEQATNIEVIKQTKLDMDKKVTSQLDKLDSLINKAENAQYSMKHQNQQMKKFMQ